MSVDPNSLLIVMSAHERLTWSQFREAVEFLSDANRGTTLMPGPVAALSGLLQCLVALGHCDALYEQGQSTISVSPPALCRLPRAGLPVAILAGTRCPQTFQHMCEAADAVGKGIQITTESHPGPLGLLPDSILVTSESDAALERFCSELGITCAAIPPAWALVNWAGSLSQYEKRLDYRYPTTLNWPRYDFDVDSFLFSRNICDTLPRYSRYRNPTTSLPLHLFFRDSLGAEADLNWGRYLALNAQGINVVAYDERRFLLCIPLMMPLPAIIARILCLCSGRPPVYRSREFLLPSINCDSWLMFEDVPPQIAVAALSKVGQQPRRVTVR